MIMTSGLVYEGDRIVYNNRNSFKTRSGKKSLNSNGLVLKYEMH